MILEPAGLGGNKLSLLTTTQIVLKAAEGASCLALEVPAPLIPCSQAQHLHLLYPGTVNLLFPEAVSFYRKY